MTGAPLIVGGGLAGAAVAIRLAGQGARPLLVERSEGPHHKVCGEFLSGEAVEELEALGVFPRALGASVITQVRLWRGGRVAASRLPFAAMGLSRVRLDEAMLAAAARAGVAVERGRRIAEVPSGPAFLATGKAALRGVDRGPPSGLVGIKMHYRAPRAAQALTGAVDIVLTDDGYAGMQLIEDEIVNLCLVTRRPGPDALARSLATTPRLAALFADAEPLFERPLTVANLPYGFLAPAAPDAPGRFRLGDQAAMIPSFTGDGMGIALTTARWAADAWDRDGADGAAAYAHRAAAGLRRPVRTADRAARLALHPGLGGPVVLAARLWPGLLRGIARATRVRLVAAPASDERDGRLALG